MPNQSNQLRFLESDVAAADAAAAAADVEGGGTLSAAADDAHVGYGAEGREDCAE